uniref:aspartate aminotransferase family protein n=1 Tax=Collinsella sp. TaxID=1965294 RepID=UPI00402A3043
RGRRVPAPIALRRTAPNERHLMSLATQQSLESHYVMHTFGRSLVEFVEGHGMKLIGDDGREYLDFLAGIGVCSLGHGNPAVLSALEAQTKKLLHVSNYFYIEQRGQVAALLSKLANDDVDGACVLADAIAAGDETTAAALGAPAADEQVWETFFANSGAEANEGSMKLARLYAKRAGNGGNTIVCMRGGFHGRTLETIAATMQDWLQDSFRPLPGGFVACTPNDVDELRSIFKQLGSEVCAVMLEPIQGESGVHPMTEEFMAAARDLAHEVGAVLIADEVQCGIFRSGKPFAFQTYGVEPDIMSLAKGIADVFKPGDHGSTFGGSCLAVAACAATLSALVRGDFAEHAAKVGAYMEQALAKLPHVVEVRGRGLMLGCDLDDAAGDAHDVVARALGAGAVINATGAHTLRFLPPLVCEEADVDSLTEILSDVLA